MECVELTEELLTEMRPHFAEHFASVYGGNEQPAIDTQTYLASARAGMYRVMTARSDDGALVGYAGFYVKRHPHKETVEAVCDALYVDSRLRGLGIGGKLVKFAEDTLRHAGVHTVYQTAPVGKPVAMFERLGYSVAEIVMRRVL